jgi:hypothetical protein
MAETEHPPLRKSAFANVDARVRCPTTDCWGDLLLFPVGRDEEGVPAFQPFTACPLCGTSFPIEQDMTDRELWQRVSWLRANPLESLGDEGP